MKVLGRAHHLVATRGQKRIRNDIIKIISEYFDSPEMAQ